MRPPEERSRSPKLIGNGKKREAFAKLAEGARAKLAEGARKLISNKKPESQDKIPGPSDTRHDHTRKHSNEQRRHEHSIESRSTEELDRVEPTKNTGPHGTHHRNPTLASIGEDTGTQRGNTRQESSIQSQIMAILADVKGLETQEQIKKKIAAIDKVGRDIAGSPGNSLHKQYALATKVFGDQWVEIASKQGDPAGVLCFIYSHMYKRALALHTRAKSTVVFMLHPPEDLSLAISMISAEFKKQYPHIHNAHPTGTSSHESGGPSTQP